MVGQAPALGLQTQPLTRADGYLASFVNGTAVIGEPNSLARFVQPERPGVVSLNLGDTHIGRGPLSVLQQRRGHDSALIGGGSASVVVAADCVRLERVEESFYNCPVLSLSSGARFLGDLFWIRKSEGSRYYMIEDGTPVSRVMNKLYQILKHELEAGTQDIERFTAYRLHTSQGDFHLSFKVQDGRVAEYDVQPIEGKTQHTHNQNEVTAVSLSRAWEEPCLKLEFRNNTMTVEFNRRRAQLVIEHEPFGTGFLTGFLSPSTGDAEIMAYTASHPIEPHYFHFRRDLVETRAEFFSLVGITPNPATQQRFAAFAALANNMIKWATIYPKSNVLKHAELVADVDGEKRCVGILRWDRIYGRPVLELKNSEQDDFWRGTGQSTQLSMSIEIFADEVDATAAQITESEWLITADLERGTVSAWVKGQDRSAYIGQYVDLAIESALQRDRRETERTQIELDVTLMAYRLGFLRAPVNGGETPES